MFQKAVKQDSKLRLAISGISGAGKTWTALALGCGLARALEGRAAVIDTEHGSASKYADTFDFDVLNLDDHHPEAFIRAIEGAEKAGYAVIVLDGISAEWDACLELVDQASKRMKGNSYMAWGDVTPLHNKFIKAIVTSEAHIIATLRSKSEYVIEQTASGKSAPRKVGMAPKQRDGMEYEFDIFGELTLEHDFIIHKSRMSALSGKVISKPGADMVSGLLEWLSSAKPPLTAKQGEKFEARLKAEYGIANPLQWASRKLETPLSTFEGLSVDQGGLLMSAAVSEKQRQPSN